MADVDSGVQAAQESQESQELTQQELPKIENKVEVVEAASQQEDAEIKERVSSELKDILSGKPKENNTETFKQELSESVSTKENVIPKWVNKKTAEIIRSLPIDVQKSIIREIQDVKHTAAASEKYLRDNFNKEFESIKHYKAIEKRYADIFSQYPPQQRAELIERAIENDISIEENPLKYIAKIAKLYNVDNNMINKAISDYKANETLYQEQENLKYEKKQVQKQAEQLQEQNIQQLSEQNLQKIEEYASEVDEKGQLTHKYFNDVGNMMSQLARDYNITDIDTLYKYAVLTDPNVKQSYYKDLATKTDSNGNIMYPDFEKAVPYIETMIAKGATPDVETLYNQVIWNVPDLRESNLKREVEKRAINDRSSRVPKATYRSADVVANAQGTTGDMPAMLDKIGRLLNTKL